MKTIEEIDRNFSVKSDISHDNIIFYDAEDKPLKLYGVFRENGEKCFRRVPKAVADSVSDGVSSLSTHTAGGRIRFRTNSSCIILYAKMGSYGRMPHFAFCGSAGFDMYNEHTEQRGQHSYLGSFQPPMRDDAAYERIITFSDNTMRDIVINMPTYSSVEKVYIGLEKDSIAEPPKPYKYEVPVVYYGSSITQGGCVSRPGNTYQCIISRKLGCDFINLGFSGSAKGEREIAEYIAKLPMSVFVYDYDHNAPNVEYLKKTHKAMFDIIREKNPVLPIIMLTRPNTTYPHEADMRKNVILKTLNAARASGDNNVCFIDGAKIRDSIDPDIMTVDGTHPNDFGFWCMAEAIGKAVVDALNK